MMANMRIRTLVVLTLLQLCRAEISNTPESWYSANVINDEFQPKSTSEIFSTEPTFSSTNPIIVLPSSSAHPNEIESMSTLPPPTPQVSITSTSGAIPQMSTTPSPLPTLTTTLSPLSSHSESSASLTPQTPTVSAPLQTSTIQPLNPTSLILPQQPTGHTSGSYREVLPLVPTGPQYDHSISQLNPDQIEFVSTPEPTYDISQPSLESLFPSIPQQPLIPEIALIHSNDESQSIIVDQQPNLNQINTQSPILSTEVTTSQPTSPPHSSIITQSTIIPSSTFSPEPTPIPTILDAPTSTEIPPPQVQPETNQQQFPLQIIQGSQVPSNLSQWQQIRFDVFPQSPQSASIQANQSVPIAQITSSTASTQQPLSNYFMIYQQAPQSFQNFPSRPVMGPSAPPLSPALPSRPSTLTPSTQLPPLSSVVTQVPQTTRPPISTHQPVTSISPPIVSSGTIRPSNPPGVIQGIPIIPMRIRVVSPSGSITNIQIKPKLIPTTTTRRPTTTRTRKPKPKKNTYDYCVNSCKGSRNPICAAPLSTSAIDPETLRGFPSICHMACHNSYRAAPFEKVADGRCGKLRTKIRPLDSNVKLKKNELVKTEYSIDETGQKAVIQFSSGVA